MLVNESIIFYYILLRGGGGECLVIKIPLITELLSWVH